MSTADESLNAAGTPPQQPPLPATQAIEEGEPDQNDDSDIPAEGADEAERQQDA